tara:strand:+ start:469 stop:1374 length:906 start_codon:yes stop_codon:yes gene_type:complete
MYTRFRFKNLQGKKILSDYFTHFDKNKYFLEKELLLKGIIYDEAVRKKEFEQTVVDTDAHLVRNGFPTSLDKSYLRNHIGSAYYDLFNDSDNSLKTAVSYLCNKSKISWFKHFILKVNNKNSLKENQRPNELVDKFINSFSLKLNLDEIDEYKDILNEELIEVNEVLGLYKSSWGSLSNINDKLKSFKYSVEQIKEWCLFKENTKIEIYFVIVFQPDSTEIDRQCFRVKVIGGNTDDRIELSTYECLQLLQLRNWGDFVKEEIRVFKEIRESGVNVAKQNYILQKTEENDYSIDMSNLEVN